MLMMLQQTQRNFKNFQPIEFSEGTRIIGARPRCDAAPKLHARKTTDSAAKDRSR